METVYDILNGEIIGFCCKGHITQSEFKEEMIKEWENCMDNYLENIDRMKHIYLRKVPLRDNGDSSCS